MRGDSLATKFRRNVLCNALIVALAASAVMTSAYAQEQIKSFDVPMQPAASGLNAFAEQADITLVFSQDLVVGVNTRPLKGSYSVAEGLDRMLHGTRLSYRLISKNTVAISTGASNPLAVVNDQEELTSSFEFEILSQDLAAALKRFTRTTGQQVVFDKARVRGKVSTLLQGAHTADDGIEMLLKGTALTARRGAQGALVLEEVAHLPETLGMEEDIATLEKIVVTGTRIVGSTPASPLTSIDRDEIERSGADSVEAVMKDLPQNFGEISADASLSTDPSTLGQTNTEGAAAVSLYGLGAEATLVLLNGSRRPGAINGRAVDVSTIPLSIVERVDVLTGASSAIYGSDAVAGVVNIITADRIDGARSQVYYGSNGEGLERTQASVAFGLNGEHGNIVAAYDFSKSKSMDLGDTGLIIAPSPLGLSLRSLDITPDTERHSAFLSGTYDLTESTKISGFLTFNRSDVAISLGYVQPGSVVRQDDISSTDTATADVKLLTELARDWTAEFSFSGGTIKSTQQILLDQNGLVGDYGYPQSDAVQYAVSGLLRGKLPLGSTVVSTAFGAEHRNEQVDVEYLGNNSAAHEDRDIDSIFGELIFPVLKSLDPSRQSGAEISLAGRYDRYSGIGDIFNPQLGIRIYPLSGLTLRATYGEAFRAPALYTLALPEQATIRSLPDPTSPTGRTPTLIRAGGNVDLEPETATTVTVGFDYTPDFMPDTRFSLSYADINYRDRIDRPVPSTSRTFADEAIFGEFVDRTPTAAELQQVLDTVGSAFFNFSGVPFDSQTQQLLTVFPSLAVLDNRPNNIGRDRVQVLNGEIRTRFDTSVGRMGLGASVTDYLNFDRRSTALSPETSLLNRPGRPVDFRARLEASLEAGPVYASFFVNYTSGYRDVFRVPPVPIESWTTVDASLRIDFEQFSDSPALHGLVGVVSVENLFDEGPPRFLSSDFGVGYDNKNANALGRVISVRLTKEW